MMNLALYDSRNLSFNIKKIPSAGGRDATRDRPASKCQSGGQPV